MEKYHVPALTGEEKDSLKHMTALALPDAPSARGYTAAQIKAALARAFVGEDPCNVTGLIDRVIADLNVAFGDVEGDLEVTEKNAQAALEAANTAASDALAAKAAANSAAGSAATAASDAEKASRLMENHTQDSAAHSELFAKKADATKSALAAIIGYATKEAGGLMTPAQVADLTTLVELLRSDDADTTINTIREVLNAFATVQEGTDVANVLASKVAKTAEKGLYGTDAQGQEVKYKIGAGYSKSVNANGIVQRTADAQINVPLEPTEDYHAVCKKYADTIGASVDNLSKGVTSLTNRVNALAGGAKGMLYIYGRMGNFAGEEDYGEGVVGNLMRFFYSLQEDEGEFTCEYDDQCEEMFYLTLNDGEKIPLNRDFFNSCMFVELGGTGDGAGVYIYPYEGTLELYMYEGVEVIVSGEEEFLYEGSLSTFTAPQDAHVTLDPEYHG